jgi:hypothetical protein
LNDPNPARNVFGAEAEVVCANLKNIRVLFRSGGMDQSLGQVLPRGLALTAATPWGLYSTFLLRWRSWASLLRFLVDPRANPEGK